jgi:hypothetical protein
MHNPDFWNAAIIRKNSVHQYLTPSKLKWLTGFQSKMRGFGNILSCPDLADA